MRLRVCVFSCMNNMSWKRPPAVLSHADAPATDLLLQGSWKKPDLNLDSCAPDASSEGLPKKRKHACDTWQKPSLSIKPCSSFASAKAGQCLQANWMQPALSLDTEATRDRLQKVHCQHHEISVDAGMLGLLVPSDAPENSYSAHAKDPGRITSVLMGRCGCCSNCFKDQKAKAVEEIAALWHGLSEEQQTQYLQGQWQGPLAPEAAEAASHRTKWRLAGKSICLRGLASLLGTAERTLQKRLKGVLDMRKNHLQSGSLGRQAPKQQAIIDLFFSELYHSVAEDLPEKRCEQSATEFAETLEDAFYWTPEACLAQNIAALQSPCPALSAIQSMVGSQPINVAAEWLPRGPDLHPNAKLVDLVEDVGE